MTAGRALGHLAIETFLAEYWQQQPVLLRDVLPRDGERAAFPLDANDLAGLACEPLAEARIITGPDAENGWSLQHGPFDEAVFDGIGDRCWTLLVQDVEKHYPPAGELPRLFDFLPSWRVDDLMVSFAAPGGSVGPHVD
ncbi:MAG: cupin domain-containing protein, partial [Pseudomonadota bacterium]